MAGLSVCVCARGARPSWLPGARRAQGPCVRDICGGCNQLNEWLDPNIDPAPPPRVRPFLHSGFMSLKNNAQHLLAVSRLLAAHPARGLASCPLILKALNPTLRILPRYHAPHLQTPGVEGMYFRRRLVCLHAASCPRWGGQAAHNDPKAVLNHKS